MTEFLWFGVKQAWACIFGALLLAAILVTKFWYPDVVLARYDFLFLFAVVVQIGLIAFRLESLRECGVVVLFHVLATGMELFKTSDEIGSWAYPEDSFFRIGNVPLFAGFMYSAVGSYMARIWRQFDMRFERFPHVALAAALAALSYVNFFTHHYLWDIRWVLVAAIFLAYGRTKVIFRPYRRDRWMPLLLGFVLVAFFIWIAENISTFARIWVYPNQRQGWSMVRLNKLTAWFLLMQLSFVLIYILRRIEQRAADDAAGSAEKGAARPREKSIAARIGIGLILLSGVLWFSLFAIPFLPMTLGQKAALAGAVFVGVQIAWWSGAALVGRQAVARLKSWWRIRKNVDEP